VLARGNVGGQGIGVNPLEGGNRVKDQNVERTGCLAAVIWLNQTEQMAVPGVAAETKEQHPNVGVNHLTNPLNGRPLLLRDGEAVSRLKVGVPDGAPANNKASIGRPLHIGGCRGVEGDTGKVRGGHYIGREGGAGPGMALAKSEL
jgi:hypothetical protein